MRTSKPSPLSTGYETERNTEALLKAVVDAHVQGLSGDDVWQLLRLTWITKRKDHWKSLKVPALAHLFPKGLRAKKADIRGDLKSTVENIKLSDVIVAEAAAKKTGFVNCYAAYRNSAQAWCKENEKELKAIVKAARNLGPNDRARFDLAGRIEKLSPVLTPRRKRKMSAVNLITPLIACLDPKRYFPIINGQKNVRRLLTKLGLAKHDLEAQVEGMIGLIGSQDIADAFDLDTLGDARISEIAMKQKRTAPPSIQLRRSEHNLQGRGAPLPVLDEEERRSVIKSATVIFRKRHNKMTKRLGQVCRARLTQGKDSFCRYDVLTENYNGTGRDLLIEVKPDPDKGSIRIAIGQLLDYRRFLPHQAGTDLAILTISPPSRSYRKLLQEHQITSLWFTSESCKTLRGDGKSCQSLKTIIRSADK